MEEEELEEVEMSGSESDSQEFVAEDEGTSSKLPSKRKSTSTNPEPSKKEKQPATEKGSLVWDHFERILDCPKDAPRAQCKYCSKSIGCHTVVHGTKAMINHIGKCKEYPPNKDKTQKILSFDKRGESESSNTLVAWSHKEECRLKLARMIVIDELPFSFVEGEGFRDFCSSMCPTFDPVSRRTICRDVVKLHEEQQNILKEVFTNSSHSVCLTTDTWTSQDINYMVLTAHFIDDDWKSHKRILNFCVITDHSGKSIGKVICKCIKYWGIKRVLTITVDNVSVNEAVVNYVRSELNQSNMCVLDGEFMHVRCYAHVLNLIVNDGLEDIHNSVTSIRSAVRYVRSSHSRLNYFKEFVQALKIEEKTMLALDLPTRWNSTYIMLVAALKYRKVFDQMDDGDLHYISYFNDDGRPRKGGAPKAPDWDKALVFVKILKTFYEVAFKFSCTSSVTSSSCFSELIHIEEEINELISSEDLLSREIASSMKLKYDKYCGSMSSMNKIFLVACVLDPRLKMEFISLCYEDMYGVEGSVEHEEAIKFVKGLLLRFYEWYNARRVVPLFTTSQPPSTSNVIREEEATTITGNSKIDKHNKKVKEQNIDCNEVDKYLKEGAELHGPGFDVQHWWKVNGCRFRVLSEIAQDVFAIPVSTVGLESAFSTRGRILDPFRSYLTPTMVEMLVTTQSWIRSKPIHVDHRIEMSIDDMEFYDEVMSDMVGSCLTSELEGYELRMNGEAEMRR